MLVKCNLGFRVIDAENVGYSYGQDVEQKDNHYSHKGVILAVESHVRSIDEFVAAMPCESQHCGEA